MGDAAAHHSTWTLANSAAELRHGAVFGSIDIAHPDRGLTNVVSNAQALRGHILAIRRRAEATSHGLTAHESGSSWPLDVTDAYLRGNDLVASYRPTDDWPYAPQLYWRANTLNDIPNVFGSISLLVSVETHLLDTWPRIDIGSQLQCAEVLHIDAESRATESLHRDQTIPASTGACCILRRLTDWPISYAEIMPANDFCQLSVRHEHDHQCAVEWELFADFLEKGVIRRAQLQTAFLPRENDVRLAMACCEAVEHRPLPLTT